MMKKAVLHLFMLCLMINALHAQWAEVPLDLIGMWGSSVSLVDYDLDNDLDIFLTGSIDPSGIPECKIYRNLGNNVFSVWDPGFSGTYRGHSCWADFNGDGYPDLMIVGRISEASLPSSRMYLGSADGSFSLAGVDLWGLDYAWTDAGDYDNDGDMDILITGVRSGTNYIKLYRNEGNLNFNEVYAGLQDVANGQCHWVDIDNDGDLDISVLGSGHCLIYRNEGTDTFTRINYNFEPLSYSASAWGDFNNDGFPDLITAGQGVQGVGTYLYENIGDGSFREVQHNISGRMSGSLMWGDFDNDGWQDLFISGGAYPYGPRVSSLYKNMGNRNFSLLTTGITPVSSSSSAFGDLDNDNRLDIVISGYTGTGYVSKYYRNLNPLVNAAPSVPELVWDQQHSILRCIHSGDDSTPGEALSYNIRIGSSPGADDIFPVLENAFGYRIEARRGRKCFYFEPEPNRQYYASAQAIDHSFAGSAFGPVLNFSLQGVPMIALIEGENLDFGEQNVGTVSNGQRCILRNTGTSGLRINGLSFSAPGFQIQDQDFPCLVAPGDSIEIYVSFAPMHPGEINAVMLIFSNAINTAQLAINLHGIGLDASAPAQVQNVGLSIQGTSVILEWDSVSTNENGDPIEIDDYILLFSEIPGYYWYLGHSESCTFTHQEITLVSHRMFYRVLAYRDLSKTALSKLESMKKRGLRIPWRRAQKILEER